MQHDNPVHVIRHDDKGVNAYPRVMIWYLVPCHAHHLARIAQMHGAIGDCAEKAFPVLCAYGNKIGAGAGVIVALQSDGTAVVFVGVKSGHIERSSDIRKVVIA
jgi:hypothetical protein